MAQFFGAEKVQKLELVSTTTVSLPSGSLLKIGGQARALSSNLTCNTAVSGAGGIDAGSVATLTFYYVYAIINSGVVSLVASTSAVAPSGFTTYRKVGAFYTNASSQVFKAYWFGEVNNLTYSASGSDAGLTSMQPAGWATYLNLGTGRNQLTYAAGFVCVAPNAVACPDGASQGQHCYLETSGATALIIRGSNATPVLANEAWQLIVNKRDVDAIQPDWSLL